MSSLALYAAPIDNNDNTIGMNDNSRGMNDIDKKRQTRRIINETNNKNDNTEDTTSSDSPITTEGFDKLPNTYANDYYKQHVPYYNQMSVNTANKGELLEKLNYMIHLLEEQKDDKTGHVTEEIILYSFLGVFMIFIVDSFARAGKYVR